MEERLLVDLFRNREIMRMKDDGSYASIYAHLIVNRARFEGIYGNGAEGTFVVPIPRKQGQAADAGQVSLAREIARLYDLPLERKMLAYHREVAKQHSLRATDRKANQEGTMDSIIELMGEDILLVDDIMTTGNTLYEGARALAQAGANRIFGLVAARTVSMRMLEDLGLIRKGRR